MSRVLRFTQIAVGLALFFGLFGAANAHAQGGPLKQILDRLDAHNKALASLRADVMMVKFNPQLNESDTLVGVTSYLPKTAKHVMYMRLDWTTKPVEQISLIGDSYELYKPSINQVYYGKVAKAKNSAAVGGALSFMNMSKDQLKANYDIKLIGPEQISGGVNTLHLELTPKAAGSYKTAELWVDGDGMPRQGKILEQNNDTTTVLLSNIQKNITIKADTFKLNYPKTVKKIQA